MQCVQRAAMLHLLDNQVMSKIKVIQKLSVVSSSKTQDSAYNLFLFNMFLILLIKTSELS